MNLALALSPLALIASTMLVGCPSATVRGTLPSDSASIRIGDGGGFTGHYKGYTVHGNGDIEWWSGPGGRADTSRRLFTISRDSVGFMFDSLRAIGFDSIDFVQPGNHTYFITRADEKSSHSVRWGAANATPPERVLRFYSWITSIIHSRMKE